VTTTPLLHGTLEILVLKALNQGHRHGYGIAKFIEEATDDVVRVEEGSLYPALYRMERRGLIEAEWGMSELNRRAKFYRMTRKGQRHFEKAEAEWTQFSAAVSKLLGHGEPKAQSEDVSVRPRRLRRRHV
jgi:transcriptional regulator